MLRAKTEKRYKRVREKICSGCVESKDRKDSTIEKKSCSRFVEEEHRQTEHSRKNSCARGVSRAKTEQSVKPCARGVLSKNKENIEPVKKRRQNHWPSEYKQNKTKKQTAFQSTVQYIMKPQQTNHRRYKKTQRGTSTSLQGVRRKKKKIPYNHIILLCIYIF